MVLATLSAMAVSAFFYALYYKLIDAETFKGTKRTSLRIKDCSNNSNKSRQAKFWKETRFMDGLRRAEIAVEILKKKGRFDSSNVTVVDIGAGNQLMRTVLPKNVRYAPVDFKERVPGSGTSICNLNDSQFPFFSDRKIAAYVFLGSFEYVLDKLLVLRLCRKTNAPVYMVYHFDSAVKLENFEWVTPLSYDSFHAAAEIAGYKVTVYRWGKHFSLDKPVSRIEGKSIFETEKSAHIYLEPM